MNTAGLMSLLGRIVDLDESSPAFRLEVAIELAIESPELPRAVEAALNFLLASPDWASVDAVRRAVAEASFWQIGSERFVLVVADLARRGLIEEAGAASILAACPHPTRRGLSQDSLRLVEVADAVCEDAREGVMGIDEGSSFRKALFGVARVRAL